LAESLVRFTGNLGLCSLSESFGRIRCNMQSLISFAVSAPAFCKRIQVRPFVLPVLFTCCLFISACDSGGDNSSFASLTPPSVANDPIGNPVIPVDNVNGGLEGLLWLTGNGRFLNLDTGAEVRLTEHSVYPSRAGDTYIELINDYRPAGFFDCGVPYNSRMNIRDANTGVLESSIERTLSFYGPAKLSPDGNTIALFAANNQGCSSGSTRLYLYDRRTGEFILSGVEGIGSFDWMPDSRLAFFRVGDDGIELAVETEKNTLNFRTVLNMSGMLGGAAFNLEISRDGATALFEVVTRLPELFSTLSFREATVWRVNLDGSGLEKLIDTSRTGGLGPLVNQPVWSPDSNWLLVTEDFFGGGIISPIGPGTYNVHTVLSDELTYVIPANTSSVNLPPENYSPTGIRPLLGLDGNTVVPLSINPISDLQWTPSTINPVEQVGELPQAEAGINRGLGGTIFAFDEPNMSLLSYSVATDRLNRLLLRSDTELKDITRFGVSPSGTRIVARNLIDSDDDHLIVFDDTGSQINSIELSTSNVWYSVSSNLKFSPVDENLLAFRYVEVGALGDQGIVVINTDTGEFLVRETDSFYQSLSFTATGDLLITSGGSIFSLDYNNGSFGEPRFLGGVGERLFDLEANPVKPEILYRAGQFYFIADIDGENRRRVFSPLGERPTAVRWTPDGEGIAFEWLPSSAAHNDPESIFMASGEATNLQLNPQSVASKVFEVDPVQQLGSRTSEENITWFWY